MAKKKSSSSKADGISPVVTVVASAAALGAGILLGRTLLAPSESKPATAPPAGQLYSKFGYAAPTTVSTSYETVAPAPITVGSSSRTMGDADREWARDALARLGVSCNTWNSLNWGSKSTLAALALFSGLVFSRLTSGPEFNAAVQRAISQSYSPNAIPNTLFFTTEYRALIDDLMAVIDAYCGAPERAQTLASSTVTPVQLGTVTNGNPIAAFPFPVGGYRWNTWQSPKGR
jgi:hypothetical protein